MAENIPPVTDNPKPLTAAVRQWRIGTISMGLTLIALGGLLLFGELSLAQIAKFWPVVLIVLGVEMVLFNLLSNLRGGKVRFTYDGLSIFMVILMLFFSTGLLLLESSGLPQLAERAFRISQRYYETEKLVYPLDASLKKLTLTMGEGTANLRAYEGNEIRVSVVYDGYFTSEQEARAYAQEQVVRTQKIGDSLLIEVLAPSRNFLPNTYVRQEVTILVPKGLDLEYDQPRGKLKVVIGDIDGNWIIEHGDASELELKLEDIKDTLLQVEIASNGRLRGNLEWDESKEDPDSQGLQAQKVWGTGEQTLLLRKSLGSIKADSK